MRAVYENKSAQDQTSSCEMQCYSSFDIQGNWLTSSTSLPCSSLIHHSQTGAGSITWYSSASSCYGIDMGPSVPLFCPLLMSSLKMYYINALSLISLWMKLCFLSEKLEAENKCSVRTVTGKAQRNLTKESHGNFINKGRIVYKYFPFLSVRVRSCIIWMHFSLTTCFYPHCCMRFLHKQARVIPSPGAYQLSLQGVQRCWGTRQNLG